MTLATTRVIALSILACAKKTVYLCGLILLLSGCASAPPHNPWDALTTETSAAVTPLDCGSFPVATSSTQTDATYDIAGLNDLNDYRKCSEANEGIAGEHAKQVDQLKIVRKNLTEAGRAQRNIADMKQEMLDDERKRNFFEKIGLYVVIGAMGFAL